MKNHPVLAYIVFTGLTFLSSLAGIMFKPYETMRALTISRRYAQIFFIWLLVFSYVSFTAVLRKGLSAGPLFLTLHTGKILWGILSSFVFAWGVLYYFGKLAGGKGRPQELFLPWSYSLIPTLIWFLLTSIFYFILPPPRTESIKGQLFSILFIAISVTLFYWKGVLYYLTLRFAHKMSLGKIILTTVLLIPIVGLYSFITYKLGIFKVPFL